MRLPEKYPTLPEVEASDCQQLLVWFRSLYYANTKSELAVMARIRVRLNAMGC